MDSKKKIKCYDWFFCARPIDKDTVLNTVHKKSAVYLIK